MAQILDLGKLRFNWAGDYSPSTEYEYNDVVKYGANLYAYVLGGLDQRLSGEDDFGFA